MFLLGGESLSLQTLQRKFKNNLQLFRFSPNVVVREVPLSLAGLWGQLNIPMQSPTPKRHRSHRKPWNSIPAIQLGLSTLPLPSGFPCTPSSISPGSLAELLQSQLTIPATRAPSLSAGSSGNAQFMFHTGICTKSLLGQWQCSNEPINKPEQLL